MVTAKLRKAMKLFLLLGTLCTASAFTPSAEGSQRVAGIIPDVSERRAFLGSSAAAVATALFLPSVLPAFAAGSTEFESYQDAVHGFQMSVPKNWEMSEQKLPDRRKITLFIDPASGDDDKTLLFLAFTPVRDDFTSLSSFGSVEQVGQMTILPKGTIAGEETESAMLSAESKKNSYYFDYVSKVPGQPKRHFRSIFSLAQGATGGAGAVLVTITAQAPESRYSEVKGVFDEIIASYGKYVPQV